MTDPQAQPMLCIGCGTTFATPVRWSDSDEPYCSDRCIRQWHDPLHECERYSQEDDGSTS